MICLSLNPNFRISSSENLSLKSVTLNPPPSSSNAGLPEPRYYFDMPDFWVEFGKDIYNEEYLKSIGLNGRQIKAVLYTKENRKITNITYQTINEVSKATASRDITELVKKGINQSWR